MTFELDIWLTGQVGTTIELPFFDAKSISASDEREWLVCNGLGSYASGSISGANTRRYHGLLTAALDPPTSRTVMLSRVDEHVGGENIASNLWGPDVVNPHGYKKIVAFSIHPCPTWVYELATGFLIKQVFMLPGKQTSYLGYTWQSKPGEADSQTLDLHVLANFRQFHSQTQADDSWIFQQELIPGCVTLKAYDTATPLHIQHTAGEWLEEPSWYKGYYYPREFERGLADREDAFHAGKLRCNLKSGESVLMLASLEKAEFLPSLPDAMKDLLKHREHLMAQAGEPVHPAVKRLVIAADQFVVRRQSTDADTIIAGYHWFNDWGRDAMISLPGLTLATGRLEQARSILSTFQQYLSEGMLPNSFPDAGQKPNYNTSDATLWWAWALKKYFEASNDAEFVKAAIPALESVVDAHLEGTRFSIKVDQQDGLLSGGADGVQLTWMDAKLADRVVTPRRGKAVEINALWFNFLQTLAELKEYFGQDASRSEQLAENTRVGFQKFWNPERKCLYDLINEDGTKDDSVRPNQLFALSLRAGLLSEEQEQQVLALVELELLTPLGLRTLSPKHKDYKGRYGSGKASANQSDRDETYHQGTVWAWLLGPWMDARMSVFGPTEDNVRIINAQLAVLLHSHLPSEAGMGTVSEIFDGDSPHKPHGCIAQAWSVAELLRTYSEYPDLQGAARSLSAAMA